MANYPASVKKFIVHKNLLDDVDANDVNSIQEELEAVMNTIGRNPTRFTDNLAAVTDFYPQLTIAPGDQGGLEESVTGTLTGYGQADRGVRSSVRDYTNVADRLDAIQRGKANHCFSLRARSVDVSLSAGSVINDRPRGVRFPRPGVSDDPFSMHNGIGVTIKRSGFWSLTGSLLYNLQSSVSANNLGIFNGAIDKDGDWLAGLGRVEHTTNNNVVVIPVSLATFIERGARISLRTSHNSAVTQTLRMAQLSGHIVREND